MKLAAALIWLALPLAAQTPEAAATAALAQLQAAQGQLAQAEDAQDRVAALTATVQAYEAGLIAMRDGLRQVELRAAVLEDDLRDKRAALGQLIAVLQGISRTPLPVVQSHPQGPLAAARAAGLVADLTPDLRAEAASLRAEIDDLAGLRALRAEGVQTLQEGLAGAQAARVALATAVSERSDLPRRFAQDGIETALLLASSATLADFAAGLAGTIPATDTVLEPQGNLPLPVAGYVLPDDGSGRPGVRIAGRSEGLVTAPLAATLLFHGDLLDYGKVVILEPSADIIIVLAGLAQTFGTVGQILPAGTPVGLLPAVDDAKLTENEGFGGGETPQVLYLEVRDGQSPVNPDTWFALE